MGTFVITISVKKREQELALFLPPRAVRVIRGRFFFLERSPSFQFKLLRSVPFKI